VLGICKVTSSYPTTKPDLVVISYDANDIQQKLTNLRVKVVYQDAPSTLAGAYSQIEQLGSLDRAPEIEADALSAVVEEDHRRRYCVSAAASERRRSPCTTKISTNPYYSLTSDTFVGSLLKSLGLVNVADGDATSADAGLSRNCPAEYIASANPKLILLAGDASVRKCGEETGIQGDQRRTRSPRDSSQRRYRFEMGTTSGRLDEPVDQGRRRACSPTRNFGTRHE
jgi:iron complex transport system substrate-binding protein